MSQRAKYEEALAAVHDRLGAGFAIVPVEPDHTQICAALDQADRLGTRESYSDIYRVMVLNYAQRKADVVEMPRRRGAA